MKRKKPDWKSAASRAELDTVDNCNADIAYWQDLISHASYERRLIVNRCIKRAARAAKRGK